MFFAWLFHTAPGEGAARAEGVRIFVAWIAFQSALYGVGMQLVLWRESGFLKSLVQGKRAWATLIVALILVQVLFAAFYASVFALGDAIARTDDFPDMAQAALRPGLVLGAAVYTFIVGGASLVFNIMKLSHPNLASCVNVLMLPLVWSAWLASPADTGATGVSSLQYLNPIYYGALVLRAVEATGSVPGAAWLFIATASLVLVAVAGFASTKLRLISTITR